jgi:hypothetical protein
MSSSEHVNEDTYLQGSIYLKIKRLGDDNDM